MERTADGHYLVVSATRQGALLLFGDSGEYERTVGRPGQGPAEFGTILAVQGGPGDSTFVLDAGNRRLAVLDPVQHIARTARIPTVGGWFGVTSDGRVVVLGGISRTGQDRVVVLGRTLEPDGTFMPGPAAAQDSSVAALRRRMGVAANGLVAVSHWTRYIVELWTVEGEHVRTLVRSPGWFVQDAPDDDAGPPQSRQEAPRIDTEGRLWTVSHVADPEWRQSISTVRDLQGRLAPGISEGNLDDYFDSVVEVINPDTGMLIASTRVDPYLTFVSDSGYGASYREDEMGNPFIDVWRLALEPN
jgi:hypothetical protein